MPVIRDANTLVGYLNRGEIVRELSKAIAETLVTLKEYSDQAGPKAKIKGKVSLVVDLVVHDGMVDIGADIAAKTPKRPRGETVFWLTPEGELSTEHPNQNDMFKPHGVPLDRERERLTS